MMQDNQREYVEIDCMFKAVIFDFDGTLANAKKNIVNAVQRGVSECGCVVEDNYLERKIGVGGEIILKEIFEKNKIPYNDIIIKKLLDKIERYRIEYIDQITILDGTKTLLETLYTKFKLALATMSRRRVMDVLFQKKGLDEYFDVIITADEAEKPKPNPEIFLQCAKSLGIKSEECVVVEDSIFGVKAAKKVGMQCIAVTTGSYRGEELYDAGADLVVNSVENKSEILQFLTSS